MEKLMTPNFTVAFPQIDEAVDKFNTGKPKYSMTMLFDPAEIVKDPDQLALWDKMKATVDAIAKDKGFKKYKSPYIEGENCTNNDGEVYKGFEGKVVLRVTTQTKPGLVDEERNAILEKGDFYSGCIARATINAYGWDFSAGKGISFGLQNVQKVGEGERFGGGSAKAEDDFTAVATPAQDVTTDGLFE